MLAWLDLEMTGLDPTKDVVVEVATLFTDDDLNIVSSGPDLVVAAPKELLDSMAPVVRSMHMRSGLLEEIVTSTTTLAEAERQTLEYLRTVVDKPGTVPLCGNSIGTDRRFLAAQMPELDNWFHYRSVDVSSVKELCKRWYPEQYAAAPRKKEGHRAMADIVESVAELAYYRSVIFRPPALAEDADKG